MKELGRRTFRCVGGLVILCKPAQILVLDPRHPVFILPVVELSRLLLVGFLVLVLVGHGDSGVLGCQVRSRAEGVGGDEMGI